MFFSDNYGKIYFHNTFHIYIVTYINEPMINNAIIKIKYIPIKIVDAQNVIESIRDKLERSI